MSDLYPTHTCFDDIGEIIIHLVAENGGPFTTGKKPFVVHGLALHEDDSPYAHCWMEYKGRAYEIRILNDERVLVNYGLKEFYERLRIIKKTKYSPEQAKSEALKYGDTTGPWKEEYRKLCKDYEGN